MEPLILVVNPGTASRKYSLYRGEKRLAHFHFEFVGKKIVCNYKALGKIGRFDTRLAHLSFAGHQLAPAMVKLGLIKEGKGPDIIAVRIVAPSEYFTRDRVITAKEIDFLEELEQHAPLHINALLQEIEFIGKAFAGSRVAGISDSAFHATMPEQSRNYAINSDDSEEFDIKRFGYHGISVESAVQKLKREGLLPKRLVVCHLGSGASVTAVLDGKSLDTTMGFSPLEGLMMSTRSGSIDVTAAVALKKELNVNDQKLLFYLENYSGLLGVSESSDDIRELLELERHGDKKATLALKMYTYKVQQSIGQMAAALGGVDALVFTGTVGERSAEVRRRVVSHLLFLGLALDAKRNHESSSADGITLASPADHPAKVYIKSTDEDSKMTQRAMELF